MYAPELDGPRDTPTRRAAHPAVDATRPFGAHLRMSWWKPLVILIVPALVLLLLQVLLYLVVGVIEGSDDPLAPTLTPLKFLAANLSTGPTALLAILLVVWMTGAPWRSLISFPRAFDARRLVRYLVGAALLVSAGFGVTALVARDAAGWTTIEITGTTIALLVVTVLTTPLQAAGEELWFRGAVLPAAASWVRAVRPALVVGVVVSSLAFAVVHGSVDPVLFGYFVLFSICTGLMAIISGGIEAPVALHVANNVLVTIINALTAGGGPLGGDRSVGTGADQAGPLLIVAAVNIAMVALVWVRERRAQRGGGSR